MNKANRKMEEVMRAHLAGAPEEVKGVLRMAIKRHMDGLLAEATVHAVHHCLHHDGDNERMRQLLCTAVALLGGVPVEQSKVDEFAALLDVLEAEAEAEGAPIH